MNKEKALKQALKQKHFHEHYCSYKHKDIVDWPITLISIAGTSKKLRREELH